MLPLEQQVCSLELAKRLKELGVKQESYFYWDYHIYGKETFEWEIVDQSKVLLFKVDKYISAFTVAELGEMLPAYTNINGDSCHLTLSKYRIPIGEKSGEIRYACEYWILKNNHYELGNGSYDTNESDARAKMLIYLIENGLVKVE